MALLDPFVYRFVFDNGNRHAAQSPDMEVRPVLGEHAIRSAPRNQVAAPAHAALERARP